MTVQSGLFSPYPKQKQSFLNEAYQRKAQTFLDKHKKRNATNQIQPSNQCGKNAETPIAFYSHFKCMQM